VEDLMSVPTSLEETKVDTAAAWPTSVKPWSNSISRPSEEIMEPDKAR